MEHKGAIRLSKFAKGQWLEPRVIEKDKDATKMNAMALAPNGGLLAVGYEPSGFWLWDLPSRKKIWAFEHRNDRATALAFSADGKALATASMDPEKKIGFVKVWSVTTGK